jgi:inositol phosphorylceramide synthase catalytic subunit
MSQSIQNRILRTFNSAALAPWLLPSSSMKRTIWPIIIGGSYVALIATLGGLRPDHILMGLLPLLDLYNEKTRLFLQLFFPFILTGIVYDFMRYFYWQGISGRVHVADPYYRDLFWFGYHQITPNEFFQIHTSVAADLLCGFAYLVYVGEYLLTATYLFFSGHWRLLKMFGWLFFIVNFLGFITYFIYPAAPPWYVSQFGLGPALMHIHPSSAAAVRFDQHLGTHFFDSLYGRGVDVYGAYPSLHVTYPLLVTWICFRLPELKWLRAPAVLFFLLMCFSAIYLQHHYVVDVLLGITYATVTLMVCSRLGRRLSAHGA